MNVETVRSFLAKRPRPAKLRVVGSTGDREIKVVAGQNWTMVSKTLVALEPETIEAFDEQGTLLRATGGDDDEETNTRATAKAAKGNTDPESIRFACFAGHLADAYRFANEVAFARMVDLFEYVVKLNQEQGKSLENMQKILGKMYQERVDEALAAAEEDDDPTKALFGAFIKGKTQGMADSGLNVARTNGKSNGKSNGKVDQI